MRKRRRKVGCKCDNYIRAKSSHPNGHDYDWCGIWQEPCWHMDNQESCPDYEEEEEEDA